MITIPSPRAISLVLALISLSPTCGVAQAGPEALATRAPIEFNDSRHPVFFRHQAFVIRTGGDGLTAEQWDRLPIDERAAKVAAGEATLDRLYSELVSKPSRSADEAALFDAVWGATANAQQRAQPKDAWEGASRMVESVSAAEKTLGQAQDRKSFDTVYDGAGVNTRGPAVPAEKCENSVPRPRTGIRASDAFEPPDSSGGSVHCDLCPTYCTRTECDTKG